MPKLYKRHGNKYGQIVQNDTSLQIHLRRFSARLLGLVQRNVPIVQRLKTIKYEDNEDIGLKCVPLFRYPYQINIDQFKICGLSINI